MESDDESEEMWRVASDLVMCSTCSGFVRRKQKRTFIFPDPDEVEDVVEVLTEAEKMRDLMQAMLLHGPFQEIEPAKATTKQRRVLLQRRMIMMETKRCPACSRSLLEMCPTCSRSLSETPAGADADEENKAAESKKKKKKSSREVHNELVSVLPSQGGKERKKIIATEDEAVMVANARSVKKSKRSREEGKSSSSGSKKKKKAAKSEDKEGSRSKKKKKAKGSSEMEGSGPKEVKTEGSKSIEEAETKGNGSKEAKMEVRKSAGGNGKTKMVTRRLDKMSIDIILRDGPGSKPYTYDTLNPFLEYMFASEIRQYEVHCEFHEYLRRQSIIRGYAEYQVEVTDDENE